MQAIIHYFLHFVFPAFVAWVIFRPVWKRAYVGMLLTMLVDLDHVLAVPIFDPCRCSIGFHPLHSSVACALYVAALFYPRTRIAAVGLCLHMLTDGLDCWMSAAKCP